MTATTNRIAFQGEFGANSDMACRDMFPGMEPLPCATFEDAFNALAQGESDLAMIPIENTIAGRVADIHYLLPESQLHIVGEYFMPIHFQLMALPGVDRSEIRTVHSHVLRLASAARSSVPMAGKRSWPATRRAPRGWSRRAAIAAWRLWRRGWQLNSTA